MNYDIAEVQSNAILRGYWLNQKNAPAERVRSISIDTSGIPRGLRRCHRGSRQASKAEENGLPDAPPQFLVGFCLGVTAGEGGDRCHEITILPAADNCLEGGEMWFHIGHDTAPAYKRQYFGNICADNSKFKNQNGK